MTTAIVLFTRDLRVHDHPALAEAVEDSERIAPLFVLDDGILATRFASPNRIAFLRDSLVDLDAALRQRGGALVLRRGDVVAEVVRLAREVGAATVYLSADVSAYAQAREARLAQACLTERLELRVCPGATVVAPGDIAPSGGDHFKVFTPYWRQWTQVPRRAVLEPPARVLLPDGIDTGNGTIDSLAPGAISRELPRGGETAARETIRSWMRSSLATYGDRHDDLPGDATSRLSPFLHLGCLSPLELDVKLHETTRGQRVPEAGLLARFLPPAGSGEPADHQGGLPHEGGRVARRRRRPRSLEEGAHGVPDRRRGYAPARA